VYDFKILYKQGGSNKCGIISRIYTNISYTEFIDDVTASPPPAQPKYITLKWTSDPSPLNYTNNTAYAIQTINLLHTDSWIGLTKYETYNTTVSSIT